ncbi:MAG: nucleotide exchange factor GrpE [bacterium]|nr:nucleotide exchange factor GrpE [bacterium]
MEEQTTQPEEIKPASADSASIAEATSAKEAASAGKEEKTEDELSKCQKEKDEYLDGWKRAKAELINYKKDEAKRFEIVIKLANEGLIKELLLVLDSFDLGLASSEKEGSAQKGMYLIRSQLKDILKSYGLEEIETSPGEKFDINIHEAVAEIESDQPSGTVIEEVEKGYLLNGRVIRPVRVRISK